MQHRILIADDETSILHTLADVFVLSGYAVETAESAHEAVSKIEANHFDVVLTDMRMEDERAGYKVLVAAQKSPSCPAVAIMTAYVESVGDWRAKGVSCLIEKPMAVSSLVSRINEIATERRSVAEVAESLPKTKPQDASPTSRGV